MDNAGKISRGFEAARAKVLGAARDIMEESLKKSMDYCLHDLHNKTFKDGGLHQALGDGYGFAMFIGEETRKIEIQVEGKPDAKLEAERKLMAKSGGNGTRGYVMASMSDDKKHSPFDIMKETGIIKDGAAMFVETANGLIAERTAHRTP